VCDFKPFPMRHVSSIVRLSLGIMFSVAALVFTGHANASSGDDVHAATAASVAVGPQYDTTHVYVSNDDIDAFVNSFIATFGGFASPRAVFTVTPTPSKTASQYIRTPVGMLSVFAFQTPIPYPFGSERTGYLVTDMDAAVRAARAAGADVIVDTFDDPIGKDAVIQWPGGLTMQLYWHTKPPVYEPLVTVPDNRVYLSARSVDEFVRRFLRFSHGKVISDDRKTDGVEIGMSGQTVRRVRIQSGFGNMLIFVTDGKVPWPYGREFTGYQVTDVDATLTKAQGAGVKILSPPVSSAYGRTAMVEFPGGYIAEIHGAAK
jgi:predicted enzyme related to lactoylglutathione lyase